MKIRRIANDTSFLWAFGVRVYYGVIAFVIRGQLKGTLNVPLNSVFPIRNHYNKSKFRRCRTQPFVIESSHQC